MSDPRRRQLCSAKQFAAQFLIQVAGIFERVVQVNFAEAVKALACTESGRSQR